MNCEMLTPMTITDLTRLPWATPLGDYVIFLSLLKQRRPQIQIITIHIDAC